MKIHILIFLNFLAAVSSITKKRVSMKRALRTDLVCSTGSSAEKCTIPKLKVDFNTILMLFSPISKEREIIFPGSKDEIDVLIATDCISEGQNLQDCDMVINYDIHWNPVRIIQRLGRIDRLGSINKSIRGVKFWRYDNINTYLNLQKRVEQRMAAMTLVGAEVDKNFSNSFKNILDDDSINIKQQNKMIEQMQTTWEDIEVNDETLGFDKLSLEQFRNDLNNELIDKVKYYRSM